MNCGCRHLLILQVNISRSIASSRILEMTQSSRSKVLDGHMLNSKILVLIVLTLSCCNTLSLDDRSFWSSSFNLFFATEGLGQTTSPCPAMTLASTGSVFASHPTPFAKSRTRWGWPTATAIFAACSSWISTLSKPPVASTTTSFDRESVTCLSIKSLMDEISLSIGSTRLCVYKWYQVLFWKRWCRSRDWVFFQPFSFAYQPSKMRSKLCLL